MFGFLKKIFGSAQDRQLKKLFHLVKSINEWDEKLLSLTDEQLKAKTIEFRQKLQKGETVDQLLPEVYAVVKNACRRMLGSPVHVSGYDQNWDMVPFDVQCVGAIALNKGCIAEMQTGEGKTLTAVMSLYLNALTGKPVHLVTVNDYLCRRDCDWTGEALRWLGLSTGALYNGMPQHEKKAAYLCDVVYGTASEFGFDYLRDNSMAFSKEDQVQRGFYYAIIDEADSILIDEARTPLIISGPSATSKQMYDELKGGVSDLVKQQRDLCNRHATDARTVLQKDENTHSKFNSKAEESALKKLWIVSKGTPNNKILKRLKEDPDIRAALDKQDLYYHADQNKDEKQHALAALFIIIDERASDFELTDRGIQAWQEFADQHDTIDDFTMLDISYEYLKIDENPEFTSEEKVKQKLAVQEEDSKRKERAHNLRQLLRAHLLMEKDVDYIIQDNKIVIIDENTGRPQPGRRFSDGLHQAIEAKELVPIQAETQTYATITLQNYFRMYEKLAGMTGTASTEAAEIKQIYKTDVLSIPTHKKCIRKDGNDLIFMTEREKYNSIIKEIQEIHAQGRPILIGTESVEISEKLSRVLRQQKLEHTVLNAKQHDKEAEIIAHAGKRSAITIATNMAGRGTDIKLEPGVAELGGLHVLATARHQSRRVDRQLRGRCARQGDPGSSQAYISFEDELLRLFTTPRLAAMLQKFRPEENEPISAPILNSSIETAQKRLEQRNATIRKHTLEYDDVMNKQRQEIYAFRNEILHTDNIESMAFDVLDQVCETSAAEFLRSRSIEGGWNTEGYRLWLMQHFPVTFEEGCFNDERLESSDIEKIASDRVRDAFKEKLMRENAKVQRMQNQSGIPSVKATDEIIQNVLLQECDRKWQEHLLTMDHLRTDVSLRSVGQLDPLIEFKREAFHLFDEFCAHVRDVIAHGLFRFEIVLRDELAMTQFFSQLNVRKG